MTKLNGQQSPNVNDQRCVYICATWSWGLVWSFDGHWGLVAPAALRSSPVHLTGACNAHYRREQDGVIDVDELLTDLTKPSVRPRRLWMGRSRYCGREREGVIRDAAHRC
jgi:hypothetical protein